MKHKSTRVLSVMLAVVMVLSLIPFTAMADWINTTYSGTTFGTNDYYTVISQKEYTLVPGAATETEMVLNNATGNRRQVLHILECDPSNPDISIVPGYYGIDKDITDVNNQKAATVTDMTAYYENQLGYNVVCGMNTALAYDNNAPYSFLVYNGEVLVDAKNGINNFHEGTCSTMLCVYKNEDGSCYCELRTASQGLRGDEWQAIGANFGMVVNDGKLVKATEERTSSSAARSMIGVKEDGTLVLVMNDGRGANNSIGFCDYEEGEAMLALGCKWAFNCDGGGSSGFVTKRAGESVTTMRSVPCDGAERPTLNAVFIVSNVGATGELGSVNITSGYDYFAPGTTYTFGAEAIDTHGYAMDMPADIAWSLSDASFGSIENGTFSSNGTLGDVNVQVESNGVVVGSKTIHVANPTNLSLSASSTVLPYSTPEKPGYTTIPVVAKIGEADVYCGGAFSIALSDPDAATLDGFTIYSSEDTSKTGVVVTLTYIPTGETLTYTVSYGEGSQILWDFENGIDGWLGQQDAHDWQVAHGVTPFDEDTSVGNSLVKAGQMNASSRSKTFLSTRENGGQVHNGNCALGVEYDFRGADFNSWVYQILFNVLNENGENPNCVLRDVENGKKATAIGMWLYLPVGFRDVKNAGSLALQMNLYIRKADGTEGQVGVNMQYNGKNINALTEADIPDGRWIYVKGALPNYPYVALTDPMQSNFRAPSIFRMYVKPSIAQTLTYYYDDITLDYSDAVDDRDNPVITNPCYALNDTAIALDNGASINGTSIDFSANAVDFSASNMTGIDASSAAVYLDGVPASDAKYANGQITGGGFTLAEGEHTVIFEIKDNIGNISQLKRTFTCTNAANKGIYLAGHNDSGEAPEAGSVYYIDVKAANVENVHNAVATIDLQTANAWEAEHMTVADGFEVTYDVNEAEPEFVTFHITNTGSSLSGDQTIVSIPVRVWDWDESWPFGGDGSATQYGKDARYAAYGEPVLKVEANVTYGLLNESVPFGGSISVATKVDGNKTSGLWHTHDAELTVLNQDATCTEDGYTGRTYCETCGSVIDWGTTLPATGHDYQLTDGKFVCANCGELYPLDTGLYQINGDYYYAIAGNLQKGWQQVEDDWYYFGSNYKAASGSKTVEGIPYEFAENGMLLHDVFVTTDKGIKCYYGPRNYVRTWATIDGDQYYFGEDGYALTGNGVVIINRNDPKAGYKAYEFTEDGKLIREIPDVDGLFYTGNGKIYYFENGVSVHKGLTKIDNDYYYIGGRGVVAVNESHYIWESWANGYVKPGTYEFGADGKMLNPPEEPDETWNGIRNGRYYVNGELYRAGLIKVYGDYYYIDSTCSVATGEKYIWESWANGLVKPGTYTFGEDGKMLNPPEEPDETWNGIHNGRYYVNGELYRAGLIKVEGDYYYIDSTCSVATGEKYIWESWANGLVKPGTYTFAEDGKMLNPPEEPDETWNGIHNGRYYVNGELYRAGLIKVDGDYYYIDSTCSVATGEKYIWESWANGLVTPGTYTFGPDGKMLNPPTNP